MICENCGVEYEIYTTHHYLCKNCSKSKKLKGG